MGTNCLCLFPTSQQPKKKSSLCACARNKLTRLFKHFLFLIGKNFSLLWIFPSYCVSSCWYLVHPCHQSPSPPPPPSIPPDLLTFTASYSSCFLALLMWAWPTLKLCTGYAASLDHMILPLLPGRTCGETRVWSHYAHPALQYSPPKNQEPLPNK